MKIRNGDHVVIITGKDKGKTGSVLRVLAATDRVVVAGVNMRTKHVRATPQRPGQKLHYEASIHISNVMLVDPKTKKRTRIGYAEDAKGKKHRVAKRSGEKLPSTKAGAAGKGTVQKSKTTAKKDQVAEAEEKAASAKPAKTEPAKTSAKPTETQTAAKPAAKKPFWKKMVQFGDEALEEAEGKDGSSKQDSHASGGSSAARTRGSSRGS